MEEQISTLINSAIRSQIFPGCVIGYIKNNKLTVLPFGRFTYEKNSSPVKKNTIYDVASITKVIPISSLALKLIDEEKLHLSDKVINFVPEIKSKYREELTVFHLLTHTVSFSFRLSSVKTKFSDELLRVLFETEYKAKPGISYSYSNGASILLGILIERVTGTSIDTLAKKHFFIPLGMKTTMFKPKGFRKNEIAPTEINTDRGIVWGTVHDESTAVLEKKQIVGSAGVFSTGKDLLLFLNMLIHKGKIRGRRFLSENIIGQIYANQLKNMDECTGLGWELNQPRFMGKSSQTIFGKTGFTGCMVLGDVTKQIAFVMLSNEIFPQRKADKTKINQIRSKLADLVFN